MHQISTVEVKNPTLEERIMEQKALMCKKLEEIEYYKLLQAQAQEELKHLNVKYKTLKDQKRSVSKLDIVVKENNRKRDLDAMNEAIDEEANKRPDGYCQYINQRNKRCTKKADDEDPTNDKIYCKAHLKDIAYDRMKVGSKMK